MGGRRAAPVVRPAPDALSRTGRAKLVWQRLVQLQQSEEELRLAQIANDDPGDAEMRWFPAKETAADGACTYPTYDERFAELASGIERVWKDAEGRGVARLVEAMIEAERSRAEVEELSTEEARDGT